MNALDPVLRALLDRCQSASSTGLSVHGVSEVLEALRSLPVEQRMEAMGMKPFLGTMVPYVYIEESANA